jgi:hypothetical protein
MLCPRWSFAGRTYMYVRTESETKTFVVITYSFPTYEGKLKYEIQRWIPEKNLNGRNRREKVQREIYNIL